MDLETTFKVTTEDGLHARPAGLLAKKAAEFKSKIELQHAGEAVNAKSIMMIMSLGLEKGSEVRIVANGDDANLAILALSELVKNGFTE